MDNSQYSPGKICTKWPSMEKIDVQAINWYILANVNIKKLSELLCPI